MNKTILVAGATGNLGGKIVDALIEQGANVRKLVRQKAKSLDLVCLSANRGFGF